MSLWFTSDLHLGHTLVAENRGFETPRLHDNAILDALSKVPADDELWILGDLSSSRSTSSSTCPTWVNGCCTDTPTPT